MMLLTTMLHILLNNLHNITDFSFLPHRPGIVFLGDAGHFESLVLIRLHISILHVFNKDCSCHVILIYFVARYFNLTTTIETERGIHPCIRLVCICPYDLIVAEAQTINRSCMNKGNVKCLEKVVFNYHLFGSCDQV